MISTIVFVSICPITLKNNNNKINNSQLSSLLVLSHARSACDEALFLFQVQCFNSSLINKKIMNNKIQFINIPIFKTLVGEQIDRKSQEW